MPIPFLLAGLGVVAAGVVGAGGHSLAKETNEEAQQVCRSAQRLYDNAKESLEKAQNETEKALLKLGYTKKNVLDCSVQQFIRAFERVKNVQLSESVGLNELSKLSIDEQQVIQLREMSGVYGSAISSGATGAATGAVIALAANGWLPLVAGTLSSAGSALMAGQVVAAAGMVGSALSLGASFTPLAAVAAPVVMFTGISASMKADENLEEAKTMRAEAKAAAEKMKVSQTLCVAIAKRSDMYSELLEKLDKMFSECTALLDEMTRKKLIALGNKSITADDLTEEEMKLIAVTRALAGAVKAVIDTPILTKDGTLSEEGEEVYETTTNCLPDFERQVIGVESVDY